VLHCNRREVKGKQPRVDGAHEQERETERRCQAHFITNSCLEDQSVSGRTDLVS
jgi:hypothetical protein